MKRITSILCLLLCVFNSYGQTGPDVKAVKVTSRDSVSTVVTPTKGVDTLYHTNTRKDVIIYYRFDRSEIDPTYLTNKEAIEFMDKELSDSVALEQLDSLSLSSISSPEGPLVYNQGLSQRRVESFRDYLVSRYPHIESKIRFGYSGEEWDNFRALVLQSTKIPYKEEVLKIIDSNDALDAKEYQLKHLRGGKPWRFIVYNILKYLRYGGTAMFHYNVNRVEQKIVKLDPKPLLTKVVMPEPKFDIYVPLYERKPLFAFKTNLLFDAASVLNISAEVPLSQRVSIAAEWTFPWWVLDNGKPNSMRHRLELLYGNIEGRYWFGDRVSQEIMTGWFAGLYAGSGKYDFEYSKDGVQGEFYSVGLTAGYAHSINKKNTLRMEYSISGGYLNSNYRDYNAIYADTFDDKWHPIRRSTGKFAAFTPTALKVSLVWMLYYNRKVKGGRR